jgi:hypothetical protein
MVRVVIATGTQARIINKYKNLKKKVLKCKATLAYILTSNV